MKKHIADINCADKAPFAKSQKITELGKKTKATIRHVLEPNVVKFG